MKKITIVVVGTGIYLGELILILILLSSISSFFPESVIPFIPDSSDYLLISIVYLMRIIALAIAILLLRREIIRARKDWANPGDFWFLRKA
jgi:hypothetical protein